MGMYLAPGRKLLVEALRSLPLEAFHAVFIADGVEGLACLLYTSDAADE